MTDPRPTDAFLSPAAAESTAHTTAGDRPTPPTPAEEVFPRPFGRYVLRRLLGRGGMGRVYLAHDPQLDRAVALKMPNPVDGVAGWRERFVVEARAAATLTHANVCPVHDVGEVNGQPYLTMAFIEGETLAARLSREGPFAPAAAAELVRTVARAMHEAHRRGIIHRDLKPANVMVATDGRPVVMDFGLAVRSSSDDDLRVTLTGVALGTPAYMPPEQAGGEADAVGPPADVYSLGVILYELLTGRVPFRGQTFGKLLAQIERDAPPPASSLNPAVDEALEAVVLTALAKSPADRFPTAGELADSLDRYLKGDRSGLVSQLSRPYRAPEGTVEYRATPSRLTTAAYPRPRRRSWMLVGAAALLLAVAGAAIYVETDHGQIVVQLSEPDAKVDVRVNGQEVTLKVEGGQPVRVRAGKGHKLEITGAGFETVSETFDLKRGDVHVARVTLKPKTDPGKGPRSDQPKDGEPTAKSKDADTTKGGATKSAPIPYPKEKTLVEVPGWQVLTDATKAEMETWLGERKKAKHSVVWLDVFGVGGRPAYAAVAALDDRAADWVATPDVPAEAFVDKSVFKLVDEIEYRTAAISGYAQDEKVRVAALWRRDRAPSFTVSEVTFEELKALGEKMHPLALEVQLFRPYAVSEDGVRISLFARRTLAPRKDNYRHDLTPTELADFLRDRRGAGEVPTSLAAYPRGGSAAYAAAVGKNTGKLDWEVSTGLTAGQVGQKGAELAKLGYRAQSVTGCPHDGAVRYCVVWVKEPVKVTPFPEKSTLVEVPGWQVLADATRPEMEKWLDERKKAKHSVMWLDACEVAGGTVFSAVAGLDAREPGWVAMLGTPVTEVMNTRLLAKTLDPSKYRAVSLSGYTGEGDIVAAALWHPGAKVWGISPQNEVGFIDRQIKDMVSKGATTRILRRYPVGEQGAAFAYYGEVTPGGGGHQRDVTADQLAAFLDAEREKGRRPNCLSAGLSDEKPAFTAVTLPNSEKWEWQTDTGLTAAGLKAKAAALAAEGFRPSCVTAYPWDGAVRYCVVWVKEPGPKAPPLPVAPEPRAKP